MGSPISPVAADVVMARALEVLMDNTPLRISLVKKESDRSLVSAGAERGPERERSSLPSTVEGVSAPMYRVLPYVRGISERLKKVLKREIDCKITLVPLEKTRRYFTKTKDPVQKELRSNVIYEIPCGGCNLRYIGTTKQYLKKRLQKHKYDCRPPIQNPHVSSLCLHTHDTGHHFTLSETKILDGHKNTSVRYMLEALHIKENIQHLVNKRTDFDRVNDIYAQLLDRRQ
ncbi:uncharacterized protein DMENIID0001_045500 [Sergentomyia squamirostris]